jgi:hypothetical protein
MQCHRHAEQLQNIRAACKRAGISRSHFYEIKTAFEKYDAKWLAPRERRRQRMPNETPLELVCKILAMAASSRPTAKCASASSCTWSASASRSVQETTTCLTAKKAACTRSPAEGSPTPLRS